MMDLSLLLPPMIAGAVVLGTHVPLGRQVLKRGIIFIDLAVAQLAGLGVILVHILAHEPSHGLIQGAAFVTAMAGAMGLRWAERHWPDVLEAIIGVVFVLAVTAAMLLLANAPHGGEHFKELLAGQLLWVTYDQLWLPALVSLLVPALWFRAGAASRPTLFYGLFALSVTLSVQLVGVYLVFASLIIPALATLRKGGLGSAYLVGLGGYAVGLLVSAVTDLPSGPMVVWSLAAVAMVFALATSREPDSRA